MDTANDGAYRTVRPKDSLPRVIEEFMIYLLTFLSGLLRDFLTAVFVFLNPTQRRMMLANCLNCCFLVDLEFHPPPHPSKKYSSFYMGNATSGWKNIRLTPGTRGNVFIGVRDAQQWHRWRDFTFFAVLAIFFSALLKPVQNKQNILSKLFSTNTLDGLKHYLWLLGCPRKVQPGFVVLQNNIAPVMRYQ